MKKYIVGLSLALILLTAPPTAQAITKAAGLSADQINTIIQLLQSFNVDQSIIEKVKMSLGGGAPVAEKRFCHSFNKDLTVGSKGIEVAALSQALSSSGIKTTGEASKFTENNAGDVVAFQAKYGIRQTGYVGPLTRARLNTLYGCVAGEPIAPKPTKPPVPKECPPAIAIPACVGEPILGPDGCMSGWKCKTSAMPDLPLLPSAQ